MKCKIENNKTSYPLISVSNSILVNFMNLATDYIYVFIHHNMVEKKKTEIYTTTKREAHKDT